MLLAPFQLDSFISLQGFNVFSVFNLFTFYSTFSSIPPVKNRIPFLFNYFNKNSNSLLAGLYNKNTISHKRKLFAKERKKQNQNKKTLQYDSRKQLSLSTVTATGKVTTNNPISTLSRCTGSVRFFHGENFIFRNVRKADNNFKICSNKH